MAQFEEITNVQDFASRAVIYESVEDPEPDPQNPEEPIEQPAE